MMSLFLEELVAHGKEGDGEAGAEEDDEVEGQLVPGGKIEIKLIPGKKCQSTRWMIEQQPICRTKTRSTCC